ncbi:MAG: Transcriptional regulator, GntR family, partial [uncultured Gemmatimonadetes bacterium]
VPRRPAGPHPRGRAARAHRALRPGRGAAGGRRAAPHGAAARGGPARGGQRRGARVPGARAAGGDRNKARGGHRSVRVARGDPARRAAARARGAGRLLPARGQRPGILAGRGHHPPGQPPPAV